MLERSNLALMYPKLIFKAGHASVKICSSTCMACLENQFRIHERQIGALEHPQGRSEEGFTDGNTFDFFFSFVWPSLKNRIGYMSARWEPLLFRYIFFVILSKRDNPEARQELGAGGGSAKISRFSPPMRAPFLAQVPGGLRIQKFRNLKLGGLRIFNFFSNF